MFLYTLVNFSYRTCDGMTPYEFTTWYMKTACMGDEKNRDIFSHFDSVHESDGRRRTKTVGEKQQQQQQYILISIPLFKVVDHSRVTVKR